MSATPLLFSVRLFCFGWSRDVEALRFCFGVRIAFDGLRDINITPIGRFYIYFLDSKAKKYVFHIYFIYNSRNIHSQINSWNYYATIFSPMAVALWECRIAVRGPSDLILICLKQHKRPYDISCFEWIRWHFVNLSWVKQETLCHLLYWPLLSIYWTQMRLTFVPQSHHMT